MHEWLNSADSVGVFCPLAEENCLSCFHQANKLRLPAVDMGRFLIVLLHRSLIRD
jgi:hypothetical protein